MRDFQFACWTEIKAEFIFMFRNFHSLVNSIINSVYFLSRPPFKHSQSIQQLFLTRLPAARSFCHILHIQHSPGQPAYVYAVHHILPFITQACKHSKSPGGRVVLNNAATVQEIARHLSRGWVRSVMSVFPQHTAKAALISIHTHFTNHSRSSWKLPLSHNTPSTAHPTRNTDWTRWSII